MHLYFCSCLIFIIIVWPRVDTFKESNWVPLVFIVYLIPVPRRNQQKIKCHVYMSCLSALVVGIFNDAVI
jgi:hypothetical protein